MSGNSLEFACCGVKCRLTLREGGLAGSADKEGGETVDVVFERAGDHAEAFTYHKATRYEPAETGSFPAGIDALKGNWRSKEPYDALMNIYNRGGRAEIWLSFGGCPSFKPIDVWFEGDTLVWLINDAINRGRCTLRYKDFALAGTYTQPFHEDKTVRFLKTSDAPQKIEAVIPMPNKSRLEILRDNAAYEHSPDDFTTEFELGGELPAALDKYGFDSFIADKTVDETAFACLDFICAHFHHNGMSGMPPYNTRRLADFIAYCEDNDSSVNCRGLAIMLASLLRYVGIRAQHITCKPYEQPFDDCHVVVDCIFPSGSRVMLDPTFRLYYFDENGVYVSLPALRRILIDGGALKACSCASYNGDSFDPDYYREYMAKNTIRFSKGRAAADGLDESEPVHLYPAGYPFDRLELSDKTALTQDDAAFWGKY